MIGAIAGDIAGSVYEQNPIKTKDFPLFRDDARFTDDTVMTVAVAQAILSGGSYADALRNLGRRYPEAGYGGSFQRWLNSAEPAPYNSWGNGSAMRVSPVAYAFPDEAQMLAEARKSAEITHNHPEGIKGAQAVALAVYLALRGADKTEIRARVSELSGYNLNRRLEQIRPDYSFDVSCQGSVPEAIIAFLESDSYEDTVRNAISLGGDSDTLACMAGAIAEAFYGGVPEPVEREVRDRLPEDLYSITRAFCERYGR